MRNTVAETTIIHGEFRSRNIETLDDIRVQVSEALDEGSRDVPGRLNWMTTFTLSSRHTR